MAFQVASINGQGSVTFNGTTYVTKGMQANDHMHLSEDYINSAGVPDLGNTSMFVTQSVSPGLSILVKKGRAFVLNRNWTQFQNSEQKYYHVTNDADFTVAVPSNASGSTLIHLIALRINPSAAPGDNGENSATAVLIQGTVASTEPSIPADGNSYLVIASITHTTGNTSIVNANITDRRVISQVVANNDGWVPFPTGTYARVDNNNFNTSTSGIDFTKFLSIGDKIAFLDGSTRKYGVISTLTTSNVRIYVSGAGVLAGVPSSLFYSKDANAVNVPADLIPPYFTGGGFTTNGSLLQTASATNVLLDGGNHKITVNVRVGRRIMIIAQVRGIYNTGSAEGVYGICRGSVANLGAGEVFISGTEGSYATDGSRTVDITIHSFFENVPAGSHDFILYTRVAGGSGATGIKGFGRATYQAIELS